MLHVIRNKLKKHYKLLRDRRGFTLVEVGFATALMGLGALALATVLAKMAAFKNDLLIESCMENVRANLVDTMTHDYNWYLTLKNNAGAGQAFNGCSPGSWSAACGTSGAASSNIDIYVAGGAAGTVIYPGHDTTTGYTNQCTICNSTNTPGGVGVAPSCIIQLILSWTFVSPRLASMNLAQDGAYAAALTAHQSALIMVNGSFQMAVPNNSPIKGISTDRYGFTLARWGDQTP